MRRLAPALVSTLLLLTSTAAGAQGSPATTTPTPAASDGAASDGDDDGDDGDDGDGNGDNDDDNGPGDDDGGAEPKGVDNKTAPKLNATAVVDSPPQSPNPPPAIPAAEPDDAVATTMATTTKHRRSRAPTAFAQLEGERDGKADCAASAAACLNNGTFALWPRLRLRNGYEFVQSDSQLLTVGNNDGFFMDQNRVGLDGAFKDDLRFRLIVDVVSFLPGSAPNDPVRNVTAAVRDAWVAWLPSDWLFVSVGQQFMPSDLEGSASTATLPFSHRSVASGGVDPGHGFAVGGLSPSRQAGLVLGSTEKARVGAIALQYMLAVSNGNGQNIVGNDNKLPAAYGRFGVGFVPDDGDIEARIGLGGRFNPRTEGTLPNLFNETESVGFVDLQVKAFGISLVGVVQARQTSFDTIFPDGSEPDTGLGATGWIYVEEPFGISMMGIKPAYRFSYYDPSSTFADDGLIENSLGVRWDVPVEGLPLSLFVDGTLLTEFGDGVRDLDNARVTALLQLEL